MRFILTLIVTILLMAALIALDIAKPLGAHPWWSQKTLMIGAPIGLILGALSARVIAPLPRTVLFALFTLAAFGITKYGQTQFAASYAEDTLAGKLWYFGWIGIAVMAAAMCFSLVQLTLRKAA
ncbi:hypothetical protein SAMN05444000_105148 [Shimia gijangensis]|uniref:Uncharacterized protein n=1 Tax=Shimia gijangensis TaxID=1470563 RepID=A0A1M6GWK0_9RHOB|nr:hypothetical protein [Shimia gijangensis]SHJ14319.1 hypothetical protein SAMN05444000_105148 [Shimia gijangensis]